MNEITRVISELRERCNFQFRTTVTRLRVDEIENWAITLEKHLAKEASAVDRHPNPLTKEALLAMGFTKRGSYWFVKESSGIEPAFSLRINLMFGPDGCCIHKTEPGGNTIIGILMPETELQLRNLCLAVGVKLNA